MVAARPRGKKPAQVAFSHYVTSSSDVSSYTFNAQNIGPVKANRFVALLVSQFPGTAAARQMTGATVDGVALTFAHRFAQSGNQGNHEIWIGEVPTANVTGTIVINWNATVNNVRVGVFIGSDLESLVPTGTGGVSANGTLISCPVLAGGFALASGQSNNSTSFTYAGNLTDDGDIIADSKTASMAHGMFAANDNASATFTAASASSPSSIIASFR